MLKKIYFLILIIFCLSVKFSYAQVENIESKKNSVRKLANWLVCYTNNETGLPYSHVGDNRLSKWCFTYDAAIVAQAFMQINEINRAKRIIDYYISRKGIWRLGGIINAVDASNNRPYGKGMEWVVHSGPNIHIAIAAYQIYCRTNDKKYLNFARKIGDFVLSLQNKDLQDINYGAIRMGPLGKDSVKDQNVYWDENAPSWYHIYSTEHNVDMWALMNMLFEATGNNKYKISRDLVYQWLIRVAYNKEKGYFNRGYSEKSWEFGKLGVDTIVATDVQLWAISAFGVDGLEKIEKGLAQKLISFVENKCKVSVEYIKQDGKKVLVNGFDFVVEDRRKDICRLATVTAEWSAQAANSYTRLANYFSNKDSILSRSYQQKSMDVISNVFNLGQSNEKMIGIPYVTSFNVPTGHGWDSPRCYTSAISNAYLILAIVGYDPFVVGSGEVLKNIVLDVSNGKSEDNICILKTTTEDYLFSAWQEYDKNNLKNAALIIEEMLKEHQDWISIAKIESENLSIQLEVQNANFEDKAYKVMGWYPFINSQLVFNNWALNDLAAGYYILVSWYSESNQLDKAVEMAKIIIRDYSLALIWDIHGWFWNPVISLRTDYPEVYKKALE